MKKIIQIIFFVPIVVLAQEFHIEERTYEYDNLNRLVKVVFYNGIVYEYQYDNLGNRLGKTIEIQLPQDNYELSTTSLTCINSSDGIINIVGDRPNNYNVQIVSDENDFDESFSMNQSNEWDLIVDYLEGGEHFIYITIQGIPEDIYKKTFILNVDEPEPLEVASRVAANESGRFTVDITQGTPPFTIKLNEQIIGETSENEFTFDASHGDKVEVFTSKACEGIYSEILSVLDAITLHPNPTSDKVYFAIPELEGIDSLDLHLFDINGRLIKEYNQMDIANKQLTLSISDLPNGIYLASFPSLGETTFKIIKE